jgi:hypothetical protein
VTSINAKRRSIGEEYKEFKEYKEYKEYKELQFWRAGRSTRCSPELSP